MKKIAIVTALLLSCLLTISCQSLSGRYERIDTVLPEVDYGYISYNSSSISHNFTHSQFQKEAAKILKTSINNTSYPYSIDTTDDYIYYLVEYGNHNKDFLNRHPEMNKHRFDIGLFRTNIYSLETELLYDFVNVYPTYLYGYTHQNTYESVVDDQTLLFHYNGKIELFDIVNKTFIYTKELYDKDQYVNSESFPYQMNNYGDYYAIIDDTLYFYLFLGDAYQEMTFNAQNSLYVNRYDDYLFLSTSSGQVSYQYAYSIIKAEAVDLETALEYKESITQEPIHKDHDFLLNNIPYTHNINHDTLTITNMNTEEKTIISHDTMMENRAYQNLCLLWNKHSPIVLAPQMISASNNRLLIIFTDPSWGGYKPAFIFEYDLVAQTAEYVGYHYNQLPEKIILIDKN